MTETARKKDMRRRNRKPKTDWCAMSSTERSNVLACWTRKVMRRQATEMSHLNETHDQEKEAMLYRQADELAAVSRAQARRAAAPEPDGRQRSDYGEVDVEDDALSVSTSQYSVRPSQHAARRGCERAVSGHDIQKSIKHGEAAVERWRFEHNNVVVITDATRTKIVTVWRTQGTPTRRQGCNSVPEAR